MAIIIARSFLSFSMESKKELTLSSLSFKHISTFGLVTCSFLPKNILKFLNTPSKIPLKPNTSVYFCTLLEFSYRFDESRVANTFIQFKGKSGEIIKDTFIKPKIIAWTQEVSANYPVTDIFGDKRTAINAELDIYLKQKFEPYGIIIDTVNFTDISVDDETAAAIQKKVTAQQELELANIEAQTAKVQAEKEKQVAQIAAEQAIIEANAKADVMRIEAEAEAEANNVIAQSLTQQLIDKIKYEKWDGKLPTVSGSGATIIDVNPDVNS